MNVVFHKNFKKKYKKLKLSEKKKFQTRLDIFKNNPFDKILNNHALAGERYGYRSINITGDLRALFFWAEKDTVLLTDIDTHSNLYSK